jgi:hypothetical protein
MSEQQPEAAEQVERVDERGHVRTGGETDVDDAIGSTDDPGEPG